MNTRAADLTLLAILHALAEEAHVSRAAIRLGMSQPTASGTLDRCRRLFDDLPPRLDGFTRQPARLCRREQDRPVQHVAGKIRRLLAAV